MEMSDKIKLFKELHLAMMYRASVYSRIKYGAPASYMDEVTETAIHFVTVVENRYDVDDYYYFHIPFSELDIPTDDYERVIRKRHHEEVEEAKRRQLAEAAERDRIDKFRIEQEERELLQKLEQKYKPRGGE